MQTGDGMEQYFSERSILANAWSEFSCPASCERHGCKEPDLHISVNLVDLVTASRASGRKISDLYKNDTKIGFDPVSEENTWIGRISLELKKPCHFLEEKRCRVYQGRPLACTLFPEYHFISNQHELLLQKKIFQEFPCLKRPSPISNRREEVLHRVMEMSMKETFLSDFYLFEVSPLLLDLKNIIGEELEGIEAERDGKAKIPYQRIEALVHRKFQEGEYLSEWGEKVENLDHPQGLSNLMEMKRGTDQLMKNPGGTSIRIAHQFEGRKLEPIHLPLTW
jgi:Fe-S-cluster containining protein